jgi:predicted Zn-dependent protease
MPPSIVEKYEQIFAADPRSRIFVELAKALLERGDAARAVDVCRQGLEHHPSSILGRVVWGRALLEGGDAKGSMDQFEIAIALDPASPYAYNLVAEALLAKGMHREALPVVARAAELQPGDLRARGWLEEAHRRVKGTPPETAPLAPGAPLKLEDEERTEPYRPLVATPRADGASAEPTVRLALGRGAASSASPDAAADPGVPAVIATDVAPAAPANVVAGPADGEDASDLPPRVNGAARPPPLRAEALAAAAAPDDHSPPSLLSLIPGEAHPAAAAPGAPRLARPHPAAGALPAASPAGADVPRGDAGHGGAGDAERIAARYAEELRARLLAVPEPASPVRRHRRTVAVLALAGAVAAAAGVYLVVDGQRSAELAASAAGRARAGLARDTAGSLREAARLLAEARRRAPRDAELASLDAQVSALLGVDHGDDAARARATELAGDPSAGDGALAARYLLAADGASRTAAERELLEAPPGAGPLVQALAGRILVGRRELESGRGRLTLAAQATPPLLRALADLGDAALAGGDAAGALATYRAALAAHPTHPRAAIGAAEARLALGEDPAASLAELRAVEADEASPPPVQDRVRFELAFGRALAASGDPAAAAARLARASERLGETAPLAAAQAEAHLQARAWDRAEAAAQRAVEKDGRSAAYRVLLARARIGRGRYAEALAATASADGRAVRIERAVARLRLGQPALARAELDRVAQGGRMPADAAVWAGLADVAAGRAARARPLLERLAAAPHPPPFAELALGRALEATGDPAAAEAAYRKAAARDALAPEPRVALGRLLLSRDDARGALEPLQEAVRLDPADVDARRALGEARLAAGEPSAARGELDALLLARPHDAAAHTLVSAAWLAEDKPLEARRAAEQAAAAAPRDPAAHLALARAALAQGDRLAARRHAERALALGAKGEAATEAKRLVREAVPARTAAAAAAPVRAAKRPPVRRK